MSKYRVVHVIRYTPFGDAVPFPAVQIRVGFFWWVTLTHCESVNQARVYIGNHRKHRKDKFIRVIKKAP